MAVTRSSVQVLQIDSSSVRVSRHSELLQSQLIHSFGKDKVKDFVFFYNKLKNNYIYFVCIYVKMSIVRLPAKQQSKM